VEHFVVTQVGAHGYLAVFVLMVIGSACIPVPSEAVMLFGGALAGGFSVAGAHVHLSLAGFSSPAWSATWSGRSSPTRWAASEGVPCSTDMASTSC
jgi:membrane protein DedA with SNARE-associated domain